MPILTITWHAVMDERTCPICQALNGYQWVFETGKNQLSGELVHPQFGVVWTIADGSRAHGHHQYNCRCTISHDLELSDLIVRLQKFLNDLESMPAK